MTALIDRRKVRYLAEVASQVVHVVHVSVYWTGRVPYEHMECGLVLNSVLLEAAAGPAATCLGCIASGF